MAQRRSQPLGAFETGNASPVDQASHGFLFVFLGHLSSHLQPISAFPIVDNGRRSISATRGRSRPEMTSPFDCPLPISCRWFVDVSRISLAVKKLRKLLWRGNWHVGQKGQIWGILDSLTKFGKSAAAKRHFLRQTASSEASRVHISLMVWSVGSLEKRGKVSLGIEYMEKWYQRVIHVSEEAPLANTLKPFWVHLVYSLK